MTNVIAFVTDANAELPIMLLLLVALIPLGDWRRSLPSLAACLTYWGAMVVYSLATMPILYPRTMLAGMVPFIGFVGLQVGTIRRRWLKLLVAAGVIALCFVFADNWVRSGGGKIKEDWDEAAFQLNSRREGEVVTVLFPELVRTPLKYYVDLPTESTILVSDDAEFTESQLRDLTARIKSQLGAGSTALFLVTRSGQTENYRTLVDSLKSEFGEPVFSWKSGNLGVAKYAARRPAP
jgi:hypothetical protein